MRDKKTGEHGEGTPISPTPATEQGRKIKVYQTARRRRFQVRFVPQIKISGEWLKEAGFEIGDFFTVVTAGPILQIIRTTTEAQEKRWKQK